MKREIRKYPRTQGPNSRLPKLVLGIWVLGSLGLCLLGCGPSRPKTIPVRGVISFNGGPPPAKGMISFGAIQPAPGFDKRPGRAHFDTSGKFTATSFDEGDGLVPGTYSVNIECWKVLPTMDRPQGVSYARKGFKPPNITVDESGKTYDFDVPLAE